MFETLKWTRDPRNPVLPPGPEGTFDCGRCMNPFVVRDGDTYHLFYGGGDGTHVRICMATCPVDDVGNFTRHGVIVDNGKPGEIDSLWCVLPCVHKFGVKWHLYYSSRELTPPGGEELGLQSFPGIKLAVSDDGIHFEKRPGGAVVTGNMTKEFPNNRGVAGGGSIIETTDADGSTVYRMYYTIANGVPNKDVLIDQEKHCAVCHSGDGITWEDHRVILSPRKEVTNENAAVAAPFVFRDGDRYRMIYCGIGTRWGFYSMSEAVSEDGYQWERPAGDENITLCPGEEGSWESQMVEYPHVTREGDRWRLFYCGNGYGRSGIGTATAPMHPDD